MSIFSKDPENTEAADLQRKLEMLNNMMDQEARAEQARRQILYNIGHCKYSPSHCLSGCCFIRNNSLSMQRERGVPDQLLALKKKKKRKKKEKEKFRFHAASPKISFYFSMPVSSSMPINIAECFSFAMGSDRWLNCNYYSTFLWIIDIYIYRRIHVGIFMISRLFVPYFDFSYSDWHFALDAVKLKSK